ncbi:hypothetical protein EBS43_04495 [bacterium]|jgi:hypothetical protein|nr:hypothetical protein [bacterium]
MNTHRTNSELDPNTNLKKKFRPTQAYPSIKKQQSQLFSSGLKTPNKYPHKITLSRASSRSYFFTSIGLLKKAFLTTPQAQRIFHLRWRFFEQNQDLAGLSLQGILKNTQSNRTRSKQKKLMIEEAKTQPFIGWIHITSEHEIKSINRRNCSAGMKTLKRGLHFTQDWDNHSERKPNKMGKQLISCVLDGPYSHGLSLKMEF